MDIVVTIPKSEYKNDDLETKFLEDNPEAIQFWVLKRIPKKLNIDDRVYFVKENKIESSMKVYDINYDAENICEVTGRVWKGCTLYMTDLKYEDLPVDIKGFQGFRYRWW